MSAPTTGTGGRPWWYDGVIYQIYVRSFSDSDGDGIGDLHGLRTHLDYIASLGVDGFWLNPCYPSPQADHGYDIADYFDIEPAYGDLATFDALLAEAHARGLRVLMDLVANHCSVQHPWFQQALAAAPGSPERARFLFRDGRGEQGEQPPNNWQSVFGGSAWTRVQEPDGTAGGSGGQWYLHLFDSGQPDFDWSNPEVPEYFDDVLRFWFDRGVDGFRIDVAHGMAKESGLPDWEPTDAALTGNDYAFSRPEVHDIHRRWRKLVDSYGPERSLTLIGELWVPDLDELALYLRPDELQQAFFFDQVTRPWDPAEFRESVDLALGQMAATGTTVTWTLANHDIHRAVTRYGQSADPHAPADGRDIISLARARGPVDVPLGTARARAVILFLLSLPGAFYLYQGEELGLPEVMDMPDAARQDPVFLRTGGQEIGRDGSRVPLPWTSDPDTSYGFSPHAGSTAPWLPQPDWFAAYAEADEDADPDSMLSLYRAALSNRRRLFAGDLTWDEVPGRSDVLVVRRGDARCVLTFTEEPVELPPAWGSVQVSSAPVHDGVLPGVAAAWLAGADAP